MAQNSRIAISAQNSMARSTTSIESNSSHEKSRIEVPREPPDIDFVSSANGDTLHPDMARTNPDNIMSRSQESDTGSQRFWFPSVTSWYNELNKTYALTVILLCYCNLINYMDRSTVAGMISFIKEDEDFNVKSDKKLGLLQTAFVIFYMLTAPLFGYLGDRYSRKWILVFGLSMWSLSTLVGSLQRTFIAFMAFRALVGVGEASYSTIAPAMISDLFKNDSRSKVLALFYFAIPVGTGLGYIVGSEVAGSVEDWRWGLRVTPFMGLVAIVSIIFLLVDPPRGASEGSRLRAGRTPMEDLKGLSKNKSFVLSTIAFTCVAFCVGALMWWGPTFAYYGAKAKCGNKAGCENITPEGIAYKFGIVMTLAGLLGVPSGSFIAQTLRHKIPNADPIVCGASLILSVPVLFFGFITARFSVDWCYGLTFLAGLLLNCNWAIVSDITLYIVIPTRRSFASATQILVSHAFGDAISPYLIGAIADFVNGIISQKIPPEVAVANGISPLNTTTSDISHLPDNLAIKNHSPEWFDTEFRSLQYALFICCFFQTIGGFIFLVMSWYVLDDKANADRAMQQDRETSDEDDQEHFEVEDDRAPIVRNTFTDDQPTFSSTEPTNSYAQI